MKRLSRIISVLLIVSMFSACIYVDDNAVEPVYANEDAMAVDISEIEMEVAADDTSITVDADEGAEAPTSEISRKAIKKLRKATPKLTIAPYNKGAILRWKAFKNATHYEIWRNYDEKWKKIKVVKGTSYTNKGLKVNKKYTYMIRAIRSVKGEKTIRSQYSAKKSIKAKVYLTGDIRRGYDTGTLWRYTKKYKEGSIKKVVSKTMLKPGTKVKILKTRRVSGKKVAYVRLSNGKEYWIRYANIRCNAPYTTKDYTKETKENFVNKKGYSSRTKYLLFICHYTQKVYLFKGKKGNWKLQRTFKCAAGKASTKTPRGIFKIYKKANYTPAGSRYVSYFKSWNAFHARPFGSTTIGRPASNGCIRMYTDDAIYIKNKVPMKTTVVSY